MREIFFLRKIAECRACMWCAKYYLFSINYKKSLHHTRTHKLTHNSISERNLHLK